MIFSFALLSVGCVQQGEVEATPEATKKFLKLRGYEFNENGFFSAVSTGDPAIVSAFLKAGMDPDVREASWGRTALISAAARGDLPVAKTLVEGHADLNLQDTGGKTALFHALEARYDEVADYLVSQPALDLNARGKNEVTALISYVWRDRADVVQGLLERGADVNARDADGDTPLHGAAEIGNPGILRLLLNKGADPNAKNNVGGTPLMWAAVYGNEAAVQVLLAHNAKRALKDNDGVTALNWAIRNKRTKVVKILRLAK